MAVEARLLTREELEQRAGGPSPLSRPEHVGRARGPSALQDTVITPGLLDRRVVDERSTG